METKKIIIIAGSTIVGAGILYVALNFDKVKNYFYGNQSEINLKERKRENPGFGFPYYYYEKK